MSEFPSDAEGDEHEEQQRTFARQPEEPAPKSPFDQPANIGIEKSNILVLGPTGVGKTLIVKWVLALVSRAECTG